MDKGAWWATVHGAAKSGTRLKRLNDKVENMLEISLHPLSRGLALFFFFFFTSNSSQIKLPWLEAHLKILDLWDWPSLDHRQHPESRSSSCSCLGPAPHILNRVHWQHAPTFPCICVLPNRMKDAHGQGGSPVPMGGAWTSPGKQTRRRWSTTWPGMWAERISGVLMETQEPMGWQALGDRGSWGLPASGRGRWALIPGRAPGLRVRGLGSSRRPTRGPGIREVPLQGYRGPHPTRVCKESGKPQSSCTPHHSTPRVPAQGCLSGSRPGGRGAGEGQNLPRLAWEGDCACAGRGMTIREHLPWRSAFAAVHVCPDAHPPRSTSTASQTSHSMAPPLGWASLPAAARISRIHHRRPSRLPSRAFRLNNRLRDGGTVSPSVVR